MTKTFGERQRGASFLEIIIAVAIIGAVFTGLASGLTFAQRVSITARHMGLAKEAASGSIEEVRRTPFAAVPIGSVTSDLSATLPQGQLERSVFYFDPPANKIKKVVVTVSWEEATSARTFTIETLVTLGGVGG